MAAGTAGRRGEKIRSDIWVGVDPRASGGLDLALFPSGETLRDQVAATLTACGVEHAAVELHDAGALPFVIAARVEAAAIRAGARPTSDPRPPVTVETPAASPRDRTRRSRLFLPGNEPKYLANAGKHGPDAVILDLEDSVHHAEKDAARLLVRNALRAVDFRGAERMVRINRLPLGLADLEAVVPEGPDLIVIPKVETADQVREVDAEIDRLAAPADRVPWLMATIESALGIENSFEIGRASERVAALTLGLEDYAADLGVLRSAEGVESMYARERLVNAAHAAGVQAIDSVYGQIDDLEGLRRWGERSRQMGYEGMGCVHPRQIAVVHEAFRPPPEQVEAALQIVRAFEQAQQAGLGVVSLGSKMIDRPVVDQARRLVERARRQGWLADDP